MCFFSQIDWFSGLQLQKQIGYGSFSEVYRAKFNNLDIAVKRMNNKNLPVIKNEISILKRLPPHDHIVDVYQVQRMMSCTLLFLELGIRDLYTKVEKGPLCEFENRHYWLQMISAVQHLHMHRIVHLDIKLEN